MYLMIENKGHSDFEAFTLLGVSTTRYSDSRQTIGMFGSGMKQAICLFLRNNINPIIFLNNLRMEFFTKEKSINGVGDESSVFNQVFARITGKDDSGKQINRTEKLGFTTEFGQLDWTEVGMGIREVVSNAIDASYKLLNSTDGVNIKIVEDNQVRAKSLHTRVFINAENPNVSNYYDRLNENFLHFSSQNKNLYENKIIRKRSEDTGKIYRRGVLVGNLTTRSLYSYNLRDVDLDESRNIDPYRAASAAFNVWEDQEVPVIVDFLREILKLENYTSWEVQNAPSYFYPSDQAEERWQQAWKIAFGEKAVACISDSSRERVSAKGYASIYVPPKLFDFIKSFGISTEFTVLSINERKPYKYIPATEDLMETFNAIWNKLDSKNLINKEKPQVKIFTALVSEAKIDAGFYTQGTDEICINSDIVGNSNFLKQTIVEEVTHYITGATDMSRDFQEFLIKALVCFME